MDKRAGLGWPQTSNEPRDEDDSAAGLGWPMPEEDA